MATSLKLTVSKVANSASIEANTSKIKISVAVTTSGESYNASGDTKGYVKIDGKEVGSLDGKKFYQNSSTTIYSKTHTIQHDNDGDKTVKVDVSFDTQLAAGVITATKTLTLDTIPRASSLVIPALYYGKEAEIGISRLVEGAVSDVSYVLGTKSGVLATKTSATTLLWTPGISLAAEFPNSNAGSGTMTISTYKGDVLLGSREFAFNVMADGSLAPVIQSHSVSPVGTDLGVYIKGVTKAAYSMTAAGQQGATIAEYKLSFAGQTATGASGQTGLLTSAGSLSPVFTVKDSRGLVTTLTLPEVTVYDYFAPTLTLAEVYRSKENGTEDDAGTYAAVNAKADYASVGGKNSLTLRVRSKESDAGWGDTYTTLTADRVNVLPGFAESKSYEVEVSAKDAVGGEKTVVFTIPTAAAAFHIKEGGTGAAFGKYATEDDVLDIAWGTLKVGGKTLLDWTYPVGSLYWSSKATEPAALFGGTWERIKDVFVLAAGDTYAAGSTGGEAAHVTTVEEMPAHSHTTHDIAVELHTGGYVVMRSVGFSDQDETRVSKTAETGGGQPHNNMPPYITKYCWERIA